jgi:hypothetical protein
LGYSAQRFPINIFQTSPLRNSLTKNKWMASHEIYPLYGGTSSANRCPWSPETALSDCVTTLHIFRNPDQQARYFHNSVIGSGAETLRFLQMQTRESAY